MTREAHLIEKYGQEIIDRFISKINKTETCWLWTAYISKLGYGNFCPKWRALTTTAHRFSYTYFKGNIPNNMTVDHLCRVRHCVNPNHLRLLTRAENVMIGESIPAKNARKERCLNGHEMKYHIRRRKGIEIRSRHCQTCDTLRHINYREKRRINN